MSTFTDRISGVSASVAIKAPCRLATTGAITLSGLQSVDGVTVVEGDRVLVKTQASSVENGIYNASTSNWSRSIDCDGSRDLVDGTIVYVNEGSTLHDLWFKVSSPDSEIVLGTSQNTWSQTIAALTIVANATETTAGVAEIATQVEIDAGTDDTRIVTPKKLANSALAASVASNASDITDLNADVANLQAVQVGRNRLINGGMAIDQRNAGNALNLTATSAFLVDRWKLVTSTTASGTLTAQRQTIAPGSPPYCVRILRSAGSYVGGILMGQGVRTVDAQPLAGQDVVVSFKARKGSGYTAGLTCTIRTGTASDEGWDSGQAGTWTGSADLASVTPTLTTSFQTFFVTGTLGTTVREILVLFNTGNFAGSGGSTDYVEITDVQLESGTAASLFERTSYATQLADCQPYYQKSFSPEAVPATNTGGLNYEFSQIVAASTVQRWVVHLPVRMRGAPTLTLFNPSAANAQIRNVTNSSNYTSTATSTATDMGFQVTGTSPSGTAAGDVCGIHWTAEAEI